jgi:hypothetical protein
LAFKNEYKRLPHGLEKWDGVNVGEFLNYCKKENRKAKSKLTKERKKRLEDIGVVFN